MRTVTENVKEHFPDDKIVPYWDYQTRTIKSLGCTFVIWTFLIYSSWYQSLRSIYFWSLPNINLFFLICRYFSPIRQCIFCQYFVNVFLYALYNTLTEPVSFLCLNVSVLLGFISVTFSCPKLILTNQLEETQQTS